MASRPIISPLPATVHRKEALYELQKDYIFRPYLPKHLGIDIALVVPKGFVYDGASVPSMTGLSWAVTYSKFHPVVMRAALVHDYLCNMRPASISSVEAADLFYNMLIEDGASVFKANLMHLAVRSFGPQWGKKSG